MRDGTPTSHTCWSENPRIMQVRRQRVLFKGLELSVFRREGRKHRAENGSLHFTRRFRERHLQSLEGRSHGSASSIYGHVNFANLAILFFIYFRDLGIKRELARPDASSYIQPLGYFNFILPRFSPNFQILVRYHW